MYRGEVSDAMMAALGLDVGANLTAEERFKQVAAVMKRRDAQDRKEQRDLRRQQKLDKKVSHALQPGVAAAAELWVCQGKCAACRGIVCKQATGHLKRQVVRQAIVCCHGRYLMLGICV